MSLHSCQAYALLRGASSNLAEATQRYNSKNNVGCRNAPSYIAPKPRKRIFAIRSAPDGSAFHKCGICGVSVAIALAEIHNQECEHKMDSSKRLRGTTGVRALPKAQPRFTDEPASPFRLFMKRFTELHKKETLFEIERLGFLRWQSMSDLDKCPYKCQASILDSSHKETLDKEAKEIVKVDDEADSELAKAILRSKKQPKNVYIISSSDSEKCQSPNSHSHA